MTNKGKKYNISGAGRKKRSKMGRKNLAEFKKRVPDQGKATHGVASKTMRRRFSDLRTKQGQHLQAIMVRGDGGVILNRLISYSLCPI